MTTAATLRTIEVARIDASNRLRPINPAYVATLVDEHASGGRWPAIRVVERGENFRLIAGGHRLGAASELGWTEIDAEVFPAEAYPDDAAARLDEIRENMVRYELTVLDRAVHLAAWKEIYEAAKPVRGRGRPQASQIAAKLNCSDLTNYFEERFSTSAAAFLDVSESSIKRSVAIAAGISQTVRNRIAFTALAQNASELILLARQDEQRQNAILGLLFAEPPAAFSVAEAIAVLDRVPIVRLAGWQRLSDTFSRLKPVEREAFLVAHEPEIADWLQRRRAERPGLKIKTGEAA
ncbi:ParB/RepB/Spo0J family partition protein [Methylopila sp. M107]|uniref:ParB/RepB/Spo0J family partition protein n=1 Tax=Methylopila sp. M107 TaxID=1101190 RepID=UPI00037222D2|nr:ParB/RepB/Spo0J family partition protein [Methylopila sp. M107]